jgi:hypothetical protein
LVDDFSTDSSERVCIRWRLEHEYLDTTLLENLRLSNSPKKDAIGRAMPIAKHDWIITTDADCIVNPNWLLTIDNYIQNSTSVENNNTNTINIEETEIQTHTISNTTNTTNIQIDNDISFNLTNITSQNIIQNTISNNRRFYTSSDNQSSVSTNGYCLLFDSDEDD